MALTVETIGPLYQQQEDGSLELLELRDVQGPPGDPGSDGADGRDGRTVLSGTTVPSDALGNDGDYYLRLTTGVADLYGPKAAASWSGTGPKSLIGPQGARGDTGATGPRGDTGETGPRGDTGATGAAGRDGRTILNGSGPPDAGLGAENDFYIDTLNDAYYGPKTTGAWGSPTSLIGPRGEQGEPGLPGVDGEDGAPGAAGRDGQGVPTGGTTGQALIKNSGTDYDTRWTTLTAASVSNFDTSVRASTLNQMAAPTADLSVNSRKLTNVADPTSNQDAATKAYVDGRIATPERRGYTFALSDAVTARTLPGMFIPSGTVRLAKVRYRIRSGTSVSFRLQRNGADISGFGTSGSPLTATTAAANTDPTDVTLAEDDELTVVISAVSGSPTDFSVTVFLDHA